MQLYTACGLKISVISAAKVFWQMEHVRADNLVIGYHSASLEEDKDHTH